MKKILELLKEEKNKAFKNGLYHYIQVHFAYNSNHIEGSTLTKEQTRLIYENDSFLAQDNQIIKTNDILEAKNHFRAFDFILDNVYEPITKDLMKKIHFLVKQNCTDIQSIGEFKKKQNFVGNIKTTPPGAIKQKIKELLEYYTDKVSFEDIIDFHFHFETIHPFEDGNGRVGRLLMFKECLKNNLIPFIIDEEHKLFYYRGLKEYKNTKGYLIDTCLSCQDKFKELLKYFEMDIEQNTQTTQHTKEKTMKRAFIFAGTNGAGKTTLYFNELELAKDFGFRINVDEIVSAFGDSRNTQDQIRASKIALKIRQNYILQAKDFNQESTLCGNSIISLFYKLKNENYQINLFYIGLENVQIAKERVKMRVLKGGHNVAENLIEKRYDESLKNFIKISHLCDNIVVFDNTQNYKKLFELNFDKLSIFNEAIWALELLNHLKNIVKNRQIQNTLETQERFNPIQTIQEELSKMPRVKDLTQDFKENLQESFNMKLDENISQNENNCLKEAIKTIKIKGKDDAL